MKTDVLMGCGASLLLLALSTNAVAEPCDNVLAALQQERHLSQVKQTEGKQTTEYRDGPNIVLSLSCAVGAPNIAVTWDGPAPDQAFYDLVGRTGSLVSKRAAADIVKASKQCRQEALKDESELATIEQKGLAIECQAFARDGGGTTITVFAE
ncbi:hypothetical protein SAMN04490179_2342 [Pseudomonas antarctica]|uniref:Uncharacterized protein n=1 Tax=Pseudomonas antarctica TaxID=219572 RepID=A0A1G9YCV3_9PSED|nr:hypothetical protein [Pseudomonas antarctica]KAF2410498.1 hypothetical protein PSAN_29300 [Pseudomonas antarctica]SDN06900.1 hypothetical protein SAMN04490179_2342 [Pseudomonas antarctica]